MTNVDVALLMSEWAGRDGVDSDTCCPCCREWVCTGSKHAIGCEMYLALAERGFATQDDRGRARAFLEKRRRSATAVTEPPPRGDDDEHARGEVVVTEKIDGTNGLVWVSEDASEVRAGSRSRWITPEDDNFGFARRVSEHADELRALGPGFHYGEWWGAGIQRRYGLAEKRWSLFNVARWTDDAVRPKCCHVVPQLGSGAFGVEAGSAIADALKLLRTAGSQAAPGFMKPEGIVVYHTAARALFKVTLEKDEMSKGEAERLAARASA